MQSVVARTTGQHVGAATTVEDICAGTSEQEVAAHATRERIIARSGEHALRGGPRQCQRVGGSSPHHEACECYLRPVCEFDRLHPPLGVEPVGQHDAVRQA